MYPVTLEGTRVRLRDFVPDDLDATMAIVGDPAVTRWLSFDTRTRTDQADRLALDVVRARAEPRPDYYLAVEVVATGELVGFARLGLGGGGHRSGEVGYAIRRDRQGRGYAVEAAGLLLDLAFSTLGLHRVMAATGPDNADHPGLRVWARGLQSLIAYWAGRPQEAVRYAQAGTMILEGGRGTVAAWLPSLEARALAQLGNTAEARSALRRAYNSREAVMPDELDRIGGLLTFPQAKQHYYAAGALVSIEGGDDEAAGEAVSALELYEDSDPLERSFSDIAGARAELALARVHVGEIEGAREALAPMLGLDPTLRIGGIITSSQVQAIQNSGHAPTDPRESAIIANLPPGNYTAIVRGVSNTTGVALVEVYDLH